MNYEAAKAFILNKLERELSPDLFYHGLHHTLDVVAVTEDLCVAEQISPDDTILLKTAALFHDSGFVISTQNHEELGCKLARKYLPKFGYSKTGIKAICGMIMATRIPQSPQNKLEQILADADLDYLGRDDFWIIGATLFKELKTYNIITSEQIWNGIQVGFLKAHSYFTATNQKRRAPKKAEYLAELEAIIATY